MLNCKIMSFLPISNSDIRNAMDFLNHYKNLLQIAVLENSFDRFGYALIVFGVLKFSIYFYLMDSNQFLLLVSVFN